MPESKTTHAAPRRRFGGEAEVEALTGISRRTLQKWRLFGHPPRFYRAGGKVLYDLDEVEGWIRSNASGPGAAA